MQLLLTNRVLRLNGKQKRRCETFDFCNAWNECFIGVIFAAGTVIH